MLLADDHTCEKTGVGSRAEAARKALQEDWITVTDVSDEAEEA